MRFYDPDNLNGGVDSPTGVFFRTEEEYEYYRGYLDEETLPKVWPLIAEDQEEETVG